MIVVGDLEFSGHRTLGQMHNIATLTTAGSNAQQQVT